MDESTAKDISMLDVSEAPNSENKINASSPDQKIGDEPNNTASDAEMPARAPGRRKSTLILTDENEQDQMKIDHKEEGSPADNNGSQGSHDEKSEELVSEQGIGGESTLAEDDLSSVTVPIEIKWTQGGNKVYVTGTFTGWRKMIGLAKQPDDTFMIVLGLPLGTHRFRFIVDNELRFSDFLPTATDQMGNFVNYVEITPSVVELQMEQQKQQKQMEDMQLDKDNDEVPSQSQTTSRKSSVSSHGRSDPLWGLTNDDDDMGNGYSRYHDEDNIPPEKKYTYASDIPPIFTDPKVMEQYYIAIDKQSKNQSQQQAWLYPPQLPPHLDNVILNNYNNMDRENNSGALPIPNHVVLNHLATTSIKHNTLAVASIVRYNRKYVTQVLYAPLQ